jgi:aspartate kinase
MIVVKFGGTSIQDAPAIRNVCDIVISRVQQKPVVVLSACAGVTNALIHCAELAAGGKEHEARNRLNDVIFDKHYELIQDLIEDLRDQDTLVREFTQFKEELEHLLYGISITGDLSSRVLDFVLSYGERMSTSLVTVALQERDQRAVLIDSRNCLVTNSMFGKAEPLIEETTAKCESVIRPLIDSGKIPVMQGFIASDVRGITTTLGRGGSDYTSAIVGAVLKADVIEIWSDVDGILTADPNIVPNALRVKEMSFQEAAELAYFGAKVLHPSTLLPAIENNIPVTILNSRRPKLEGTSITAQTARTDVAVKSISYKSGITVLNISSTRMLGSYGFMKKIFDIFNDHSTSVDLVTTSEVSVSLSIEHSPDLTGLLQQLEEFGSVTIQEHRAIVCIVGENIKRERGLAARIFGRLLDVPIDMISQGGSETNVTFVIREEDISRTVKELHDEFFSSITVTGVFE